MKKKKMKWCDLPDECWGVIFNRLGHHRNLEPLSLVCKSFLSITNRIRTHFTMDEPTFLIHGTLSPFFPRFRNLTSISLVHFRGDLNESLVQIAASDLKIETLNISKNTCFPIDGLALLGKNIKVLICSRVKMLSDPHLAFIADSFPLLEELDISHLTSFHSKAVVLITESGIEHFASRVTKKLRKINISGNTIIGDKSILAIFSNCFHLSEIEFLDCRSVTEKAFQIFVKKSSMDYNQISQSPLVFPSNQLYRVLSSLHIGSSSITDEFLTSIANAGFPLKKLTLQKFIICDKHFTFSGLSFLLQTYHSLDYLSLNSLFFLDDTLLAVLSAYFRCMIKIKLRDCINLSYASLFLLIKNCPVLEDIEMKIFKGKRNFINDSVENPRIKSLNLAWSVGLIDKCLIILSSICPNLKRLVVSFCPRIRNRGLERILNKCTEISHLDISNCSNITCIGTGGTLKKLKFMEVDELRIDNIGLTMIGTRCSELERFSVKECWYITGDGFMEITRNCKKLKYIHMASTKVSQESFDRIVLSMPSLVMVVPPSGPPFAMDSVRTQERIVLEVENSVIKKGLSLRFNIPALDEFI